MIGRTENGAVVELRETNWSDVPENKRGAFLPVEGDPPSFNPLVERLEGPTYMVDGTRILRQWAKVPLSSDIKQKMINDERDRRLQRFVFAGVEYDFDDRSANRIDKARGSALAAIIAGAQPNDLRWADPNTDFGWIAADNSFHTMDAQTCLAFGNAAAAWEGLHIVAARALKDSNPIPDDYTDDAHWP